MEKVGHDLYPDFTFPLHGFLLVFHSGKLPKGTCHRGWGAIAAASPSSYTVLEETSV